MEFLKVTVDGVSMGLQKKTATLKKLEHLKGIAIKVVQETKEERGVRLEQQRQQRRSTALEKQRLTDEQPSMIDGASMVKAYFKPEA